MKVSGGTEKEDKETRGQQHGDVGLWQVRVST